MKTLFFLVVSVIASLLVIGLVGRFVAHLVSNVVWLGLIALIAFVVFNALTGKGRRQNMA